MTTKYNPTDEEVQAEREYALDIPAANLLPLAMALLHRLHDSDYSLGDDQIETFFLKGVFDKDRPNGFGGSLLVLEVLDGDESEEDDDG